MPPCLEDPVHYVSWTDLVEIDALLSRSGSPKCVWPIWLCPEYVAIGIDPLLNATGCGYGFHPVY